MGLKLEILTGPGIHNVYGLGPPIYFSCLHTSFLRHAMSTRTQRLPNDLVGGHGM